MKVDRRLDEHKSSIMLQPITKRQSTRVEVKRPSSAPKPESPIRVKQPLPEAMSTATASAAGAAAAYSHPLFEDEGLRELLRPDCDYVLMVEQCYGCAQHAFSLRHDESKYSSIADSILQNCAVAMAGYVATNLPLRLIALKVKAKGSRVGALEVSLSRLHRPTSDESAPSSSSSSGLLSRSPANRKVWSLRSEVTAVTNMYFCWSGLIAVAALEFTF